MPELPEVQTTVTGLQKVLPRLTIVDVWTDLAKKNQTISHFKNTLKDEAFYKKFKKIISGQKVLSVERRAKNILVHISGGHTILIHMKMTGHLLYGTYSYNKKTNSWSVHSNEKNEALRDPYNRFIHVVFTLSNGKHLVFCDSRKFGKITLLPTNDAHNSIHLKNLGPEPLEETFSEKNFIERLSTRPSMKIKTALMDQTLLSGIGNIYSDELLWLANVRPDREVSSLSKNEFTQLYNSMKKILLKGIDFGGDSTSDYRQIDGARGNFHHNHNVYRKRDEKCGKRGCTGVILRNVIGGRSAHYCSVHQK